MCDTKSILGGSGPGQTTSTNNLSNWLPGTRISLLIRTLIETDANASSVRQHEIQSVIRFAPIIGSGFPVALIVRYNSYQTQALIPFSLNHAPATKYAHT